MKVNWPWARPKDNYWVLSAFVLGSELVGFSGTFFTTQAIPNWYTYLHKPPFSPPNWVFGPVWVILYLLIGLVAYIVWRRYQFNKKSRAFWTSYATQMALNFLWTPLFFGLHWVGLALIEIFLLWYFIYDSMREGTKLVEHVAYLLVPYLAWITFATLLNLSILVLN